MTAGGRAERARLQERLGLARRGGDLLARKQRILEDELEHLELRADRIRTRWADAAAAARVWLGRAVALGGTGPVDAAARDGARVLVEHGEAMGVPVPLDARCALPVETPVGADAALPFALRAHRSALDAAAGCAAVDHAIGMLHREVELTRVRRRAIERRWVPRLEDRLTRIRRQLEELELEEALQRRWAMGLGADERETR